MTLLTSLHQAPPVDFADRFAGDAPAPKPLPRLSWILAGLVLLCLVPRALMAWRIGAVCDDAYYYIYAADALDRGDIKAALSYLNLNVYPIILFALHRLGLDWVIAGQLWSVTASSLLVLPMFGWIRRHFSNNVALTACVLYAVHPELIELSAEPIRENTFWLFAMLTLYFASRAITELKVWQFVLSGIAMAAAIHARTEGWVLLVVAAWWAVFRFAAITSGRRRLAFGTLLSLAMTPALLLVMNVTLLRDYHRWEWGRLSHFQICCAWLMSDANSPDPATATSPAGSGTASTDGAVAPAQVAPSTQAHVDSGDWQDRAHTYVDHLVGAIEPVNGILLLIGVFVWRHLLLQRDKSALLFGALAMLLAVWIRLYEYGTINGRYFLTIFFFSAPSVALGALFVLHRVSRLAERVFSSKVLARATPAALALLIAAVFSIDALSTYHDSRRADAQLGRWLEATHGPFRSVVVQRQAIRVGYHTCRDLPDVHTLGDPLKKTIDKFTPDLLILFARESSLERRARLTQRAVENQLTPLDTRKYFPSRTDYLVFLREPAGHSVVAGGGTGKPSDIQR